MHNSQRNCQGGNGQNTRAPTTMRCQHSCTRRQVGSLAQLSSSSVYSPPFPPHFVSLSNTNSYTRSQQASGRSRAASPAWLPDAAAAALAAGLCLRGGMLCLEVCRLDFSCSSGRWGENFVVRSKSQHGGWAAPVAVVARRALAAAGMWDPLLHPQRGQWVAGLSARTQPLVPALPALPPEL